MQLRNMDLNVNMFEWHEILKVPAVAPKETHGYPPVPLASELSQRGLAAVFHSNVTWVLGLCAFWALLGRLFHRPPLHGFVWYLGPWFSCPNPQLAIDTKN